MGVAYRAGIAGGILAPPPRVPSMPLGTPKALTDRTAQYPGVMTKWKRGRVQSSRNILREHGET
jgi:hypothetical protein